MGNRATRRIAAVAIACVGLLAVSAIAAADTGDLATSWSGDGIKGQRAHYGVAMAPLESRRLYTTSYLDIHQGDMQVARYQPNGTPGFTTDGQLLRDFSPSSVPSVSFPVMVLRTPLNRPQIIGEYYTGTSRLGVTRLTTGLEYENSFSGDGRVTYRVFPRAMDTIYPFSGSVLPGGRTMIAVAGFDGQGAFVAQSVVRLNPDGSLDTSFSSDGNHVIPLNNGDVEPAPNGAMFINTPQNGGWVERIRKVNPSATGLDTTFSGNGLLDVNCSTHASMDLDLDAQGRLLATCIRDLGTSVEFRFFRFTPTGGPDLTFSGNGKLSRTVPIDATDGAWGLVYSDQGEVWIVTNDSTDDSVVRTYKLTEGGEPDLLWNGDGEASASLGFPMELDNMAFGGKRLFVSARKNRDITAIAAFEADPLNAEPALAPEPAFATVSSPKPTTAPDTSARDTKLGATLR